MLLSAVRTSACLAKLPLTEGISEERLAPSTGNLKHE